MTNLLNDSRVHRWTGHQLFTNVLKYQLWILLREERPSGLVNQIFVQVSEGLAVACGAPSDNFEMWVAHALKPVAERQIRVVFADNKVPTAQECDIGLSILPGEFTHDEWTTAASVDLFWLTDCGLVRVSSRRQPESTAMHAVVWRAPDGLTRTFRPTWAP